MKNSFFLIFFCLIFSSISAHKSLFKKDTLGSKNSYAKINFQQPLYTTQLPVFTGEYSNSISNNIEILEEAFASENPISIHKGYRLLGYDYMAINDTILAKESFEKSEKFAQLSENDAAIAQSYTDLANFYRKSKKDYKMAFSYHDLSIKLYSKINDSAGLSRAYYSNILSAIEAKDFRKVYTSIIKAKKLKGFKENTALGISLDYYLGEYYVQKRDFKIADFYLLKAIKAAENENFTIELENAYGYYYKSLQKQNKYKEAFKALSLYEHYKNENRDNIKLAERAALSAQFQIAEYRKDIKTANLNNLLQAEIVKNKSKINTILIFVSACFLLLLIALFSASRKRIVLVKKLRIKNKKYLIAKEHAEKLSEAKNSFFSTISHELRTPLYGVIGLSNILMEDKSLKDHKSDIKSLKFSADYLLALINDVLQINKLDSNDLENEEEHTTFDPRDLIETITTSFEYIRILNDNNISLEIPDNMPELVRGNSVRLSRILMNIIGNACKFTKDGDIYIKTEVLTIDSSLTTIKFTIKDTGIGIPKEKQESIFDEFSQIDSNNFGYQGTGLGLPIVKKLLAASNSSIDLKSELGKGSAFSFILSFEVIEKAINNINPKSLEFKKLKGKKILVVEDNLINQIVTQKILEKNNFICTIAENGQLAINKVKEESFDLVLMDINMPVKNGIEATKEIRKFNTNIPIIALTAVEIEEIRHKIYLAGMDDIILKPYDISKFIETITKNITLNRQENKSHLQVI